MTPDHPVASRAGASRLVLAVIGLVGLLTAAGLAVSAGHSDGVQGTGTVRLVFTERGSSNITAATGAVYFESAAVGSRQRAVGSFRQPFEIDAMPAGVWRLTVVAQSMTSVLVASQVHEFTVAPGSVTTRAVDLIAREGAIRVVDASGAPAGGAHYYTSPSSVNSSADDEGAISLAMLAAGTHLVVRTIHWGMTCHRVTMADRQTVVVPDATEELIIVAPATSTTTLPQRRQMVPSAILAGTTIAGLPGADCAIPWEHFPVTLSRAGGMTEHTMLLPHGGYTIRLLDGRILTAHAPGRIEVR